MEQLSKAILRTVSLSLDAIFKASDTDIRIHGIDKIPDGPVMFVVNHFTRLETTVIPYILYKHTKKFALSLAHYSFFGGSFGRFMEKIGAVSTKDPERDKIFIRSLLLGNNTVVIFPEGQMIKDKKMIERGKYMVYNMGIRRPPHTGAARLALMAQFYREKIRKFHHEGDHDSIMRYREYFDLEGKDIEVILRNDTTIIPINITYYPIRARNNAVNKIVDKFVKDVSERFVEEIEVEGTMIIDGVDIDINFGNPIDVDAYLRIKKRTKNAIDNESLYLQKNEFHRDRPFKKIDVKLMQRYMDGIYNMTTVNHDHIFSYILCESKKNRISENDFKNRAFLAICNLVESPITNHHTSLALKQFYLLTDDYHEKFKSFIDAAVSDNLITLENGWIIKNREKFNRVYKFHTIRKDNIIEVMKNEIEPLTELVSFMRQLMRIPAPFVRRKIRNHFVNLELDLFEKDYEEFYIEGESKPKNIGKPFFLKRFFNKRGIILIHGYLAAPEEIRPLADFLFKKGYTVYGARLRGHGTAPEDLAIRNWEKWYDSVGRAYIIIKNTTDDFVIGGFSTGAGLALLQTANKEGRFKGVFSINAPLKLQNIASNFSSAIVVWNKLLKKIKLERATKEFVTNTPENAHINYFRNPISGVNELEKLMKEVEDRLKYITSPTLIIQGSEDPVVNPVSGLEIFDKLGTEDRELYRVYAKRHGIVRGKESEKVNSRVLEFLLSVFEKNKKS